MMIRIGIAVGNMGDVHMWIETQELQERGGVPRLRKAAGTVRIA
jgi:hypothetical protein